MKNAIHLEERIGRLRNPIFRRELLTLLRSRKAVAFLAVYLLASAAVVLAAWPKGTTTILVQGQVSRDIFYFFAVSQTLLLALAVPATLAPGMTTEKEGETLDLLLTTPLGEHHILVGKLLSGLLYFGVLLLASVPVLLWCFVIGGVSAWDVAGLYLLLGTEAVLFGLVCLAWSTFLERSHVAVILSYFSVGGLALLMLVLYGDGIVFLGSARSWSLAMTASASLALYVSIWARLRRPFSRAPKREEVRAPRTVGLLLRRDAWPDRWVLPPRSRKLMPDAANPLYRKEGLTEITGSGVTFVRLVIQFSIFASLGVAIYCMAGRERNEAGVYHPIDFPYSWFLLGYAAMIGSSLAAGNLTREKEQHTVEHLLLTLVPRWRIVAGKFLYLCRAVAGLEIPNGVCLVVLAIFSGHAPIRLLLLPALLLSTIAATVALGLFFSLRCRTTLAATVNTYAATGALLLGPVLFQSVLLGIGPEGSPADYAILHYLSPFLACQPHGSLEWQYAIGCSLGLAFAALVLLAWTSYRLEPSLKSQLGAA